MKLIPGESWNAKLDQPVSVYVPGQWAMGQVPGPEVLVPGSCCFSCSIGICMVGMNHRSQKNPFGPPPTEYEYWETFLVPIYYNEFTANFRPSRWAEIGSHRPELIGQKVVFEPSQLEYTSEQAAEMVREQSPGHFYAECVDIYDRWGLRPGQSYNVEHLFEEPFIKVSGVPIVMSTEVWRL